MNGTETEIGSTCGAVGRITTFGLLTPMAVTAGGTFTFALDFEVVT